ncbi:MAG: lactate utilization protein [Chloroflexota bacterium]
MSSRDKILQALRANRSPFDDVTPRPAAYLPVTQFTEKDLLARFTAELERLTGKVHDTPDHERAIQIVLDLIGTDKTVLGWEDLPLPGLPEALAAQNIQTVIPHARHADRAATLANAEPIRVGITGADAAFATTGTLVLVTREHQGRVPSMLPPVHVALLARQRLFTRMEDWLTTEGRAALLASNSISFVSGPSRTSDIEMQSILGVHGPGIVHVVVF